MWLMKKKGFRVELRGIQIQTIDFCNRSCDFCPNRDGLRKTGELMEQRTLEAILDQLAAMKYHGRISPYLMNEPLLDERIFDVIARIRERFPDNIIFINTNGDRLLADDVRTRLVQSTIDGVHVNVYGDRKEYEQKERILRDLAEQDEHVLLRQSVNLHRMPERNGKVNFKLRWMAEAPMRFWNRAGNISGVAPAGHEAKRHRCRLPFRQMYINYRGDAVLCCSDWKFEVIMGNVHEHTLEEIWNNKIYQKYRTMHERRRGKEMPLCCSCNRIRPRRG